MTPQTSPSCWTASIGHRQQLFVSRGSHQSTAKGGKFLCANLERFYVPADFVISLLVSMPAGVQNATYTSVMWKRALYVVQVLKWLGRSILICFSLSGVCSSENHPRQRGLSFSSCQQHLFTFFFCFLFINCKYTIIRLCVCSFWIFTFGDFFPLVFHLFCKRCTVCDVCTICIGVNERWRHLAATCDEVVHFQKSS